MLYSILHPKNGEINHQCEEKKYEYEHICTIDAENKAIAFEMCQNDISEEYAKLGKRSTCIGDIIVEVDTNTHYFFKRIGMSQISSDIAAYVDWSTRSKQIKNLEGKIDLYNETTVEDVLKTSDSHDISFEVPWFITEQQAKDLQEQLGYPLPGYGFYQFKPSLAKSTWKCQRSCD